MERAFANARSLGWEPVVMPNASARRDYLAGSDEERARDLNSAFADASIDGIWCLRGGYGSIRLLDLLDWSALERRPKAIIGYSDVTALHRAIQLRARLVSFHGPMAFEHLDTLALDRLALAVGGHPPPIHLTGSIRVIRPGRAKGILGGGNLAVLAALCGSDYMRALGQSCLVLEDVKESTYRIDRLLTQLRLSGVLGQSTALLFGAFTERDDDPSWSPDALDRLLDETAQHTQGPVASGMQVGHIPGQFTLPFGATAEITVVADSSHIDIRFLHEHE